MSKYIKLEDALSDIDNLWDYDSVDGISTKTALKQVMTDLSYLPTIDIVHCKDCIHCADDWNGNEPQFTCELGRCTESVYPNDYCSCGERIDNE